MQSFASPVCVLKVSSLIFIFFLNGLILGAQPPSRAELQSRKNQLLKEIEAANKELKATGKSLESITFALKQLDRKIALREALIVNYQKEIALLSRKIDSCLIITGQLESRLEKIKADYARMVATEYKLLSHSDERLYLLAARDLNDAYLRRSYFRSMRNYRRWMATEITQRQAELAEALDVLRRSRQEAAEALKAQEMQKAFLAAEMAEKQKLAAQLKAREKEIRQTIARKEKERKELEARIKKLIEEEIAAERRRAEARAAKERARRNETGSPVASAARKPPELRATPEAAELSGAFENNRGRLPWPVERGALGSGFGIQAHAYLKNVSVRNDGIDILAPGGAPVRAVFRGTVSGVFPVHGFGNVVIIRHGEYLTVYANLDKVSVGKGTAVSARQTIGYLPIGEGHVTMNFQIRRGTEPLNPLHWLQQ
jgi:septal ring factor EnvC (AmiA/AmiB activator)